MDYHRRLIAGRRCTARIVHVGLGDQPVQSIVRIIGRDSAIVGLRYEIVIGVIVICGPLAVEATLARRNGFWIAGPRMHRHATRRT